MGNTCVLAPLCVLGEDREVDQMPASLAAKLRTRQSIGATSTSVEHALAGKGCDALCECYSDCSDCGSGLSQCQVDLDYCNSETDECSSQLYDCEHYCDGCKSDLSDCRSENDVCSSSLRECNFKKASCTSQLSDCHEQCGSCDTKLQRCGDDAAEQKAQCPKDMAKSVEQVNVTAWAACEGKYCCVSEVELQRQIDSLSSQVDQLQSRTDSFEHQEELYWMVSICALGLFFIVGWVVAIYQSVRRNHWCKCCCRPVTA